MDLYQRVFGTGLNKLNKTKTTNIDKNLNFLYFLLYYIVK